MDCCGNFKMIGDLKDCSDCLLPHSKIGYDYIIKMLKNNKKSIDK
jgi:Zn-finger protein